MRNKNTKKTPLKTDYWRKTRLTPPRGVNNVSHASKGAPPMGTLVVNVGFWRMGR